MSRRPVQVAVAVLGAGLLAGCGGKDRVAADDVAAAVAEQVGEQAGAKPDVDCR